MEPLEKLGLVTLSICFLTLLAIGLIIFWHDRHPT